VVEEEVLLLSVEMSEVVLMVVMVVQELQIQLQEQQLSTQ
jgi:hypothetical protein